MKKRLLSSLLTLCMVMSLLPTAAFAAGTDYGAFTVSDATAASYNNHVLTVTKSCTISMAAGTATTTDRIVVESGKTANITLKDVNIQFFDGDSNTSGTCAFDMTGAKVNLTLEGTNTLKSGWSKAGLQAPDGATLTIGGTGTLNATGGVGAAGIGGGSGGDGGKSTILGGTIYATAGRNGAGIGGGYQGAGGEIAISGGKVDATGGDGAAGIGGGAAGGASGTIAISGGTVTAKGGMSGAGIGGGYQGAGGTIAISGGTVTATCGDFDYSIGEGGGAGIGGGYQGAGGTIAISGGTVTANGNNGCAGIGGGYCVAGGTIAISGGTVTANGNNGGADIGKGVFGSGGTTKITGGTVKAINASITTPTTDGTTAVHLAKLPATGFTSGTAINVKVGVAEFVDFKIPAKHDGDAEFFYLYLPAGVAEATVGATKYTCTVADNKANVFAEKAAPATSAFTVAPSDAANYDNTSKVLTVTKSCTISMAAGTTTTDSIKVPSGITANITLSGVNIQFSDGDNSTEGTCAFDMTGATVNLTLEGTNTLKSGWNKAGLQAPAGATLTIDGTGTLNATGGVNSAGIGGGGNNGVGGNITISGCTVTATGGAGAAGIGGGGYGAGGTITISGGTVTATAGTSGQDIGNGAGGAAGTTTITGGSVKAATGTNGNINPAPTNGTNPVYLAKLPATGFTSGSDIKVKVGSVDFKIPAKHDSDDNFYLYLPKNSTEVTATVGTKEYTCTVADNNANVFTEKAASDGVTTETALNQAIADAPTNGTATTIKLGGDITAIQTVNIPTDKNIILDLNGKKLSSGKDAIKLNGTASLEVKDTSAGATGVLSTTMPITTTILATGSGTVTISSGTVLAGENAEAIVNSGSGTVNVSGGKVLAYAHGIISEGNGTINVSGGTLAGIFSSGGTVTISGGTLREVLASTLNLSGDPTLTVYLHYRFDVGRVSCDKVNITGALTGADGSITLDGTSLNYTQEGTAVATATTNPAHAVVSKFTLTKVAGKKLIKRGENIILAYDGPAPNWADGLAVTTTWDNGGAIGTAKELAQFAYNVNHGKDYAGKTITLSNGINLSTKDWTPIGADENNPFKGTFDGQGYKITGIKIGSSSSPNTTLMKVGLFGFVDAGTIKNLGVDVAIYSRTAGGTRLYIGGLVGNMLNAASVTKCYATGTIVVGNVTTAGGLIGGSDSDSRVDDSYADVKVTGGGEVTVGGLMGENAYNSAITNCYATGSVSGGNGPGIVVGGLVGLSAYCSIIRNSYATGNLSGGTNAIVGGLAGQGFSVNIITNCYWNNEATQTVAGTGQTKKDIGQVASGTVTNVIGMTASEMKATGFVKTLNDNVAALANQSLYEWVSAANGYPVFRVPTTTWDNGGTIGTAEELAQFAYNVNYGKDYAGKTITLSRDISLSGKDWTPIGTASNPFKGTFDGNGKKINGMTIGSSTAANSTLDNVGLFGSVDAGSIKNLGVDAEIYSGKGTAKVGGMVGSILGGGNITNCNITGSVTGAVFVGGLVGTMDSNCSITDCYVIGNVTGGIGAWVGGLVSQSVGGIIFNCYTIINVTGGSNCKIGGLVARIQGCVIRNVYTTGKLVGGDSANIGGLLGQYDAGDIRYAYWDSDARHIVKDVEKSNKQAVGVGAGAGTGSPSITAMNSSMMKLQSFVTTLNANVAQLPAKTLCTWKTVANDYPTFSKVELDTTAPNLAAGVVNRTSDTNATVKFTSNEAGTYYYNIGSAVANTTTGGTTFAAGEVTISLTTLTSGAKDIYIVVKDLAGNVSVNTFKITIPAYVSPDIATVNNAKAAAEGTSYSNMTQAAAIDEATIANAVKTTAETAIKDSSVTVTVTNASYTAPIAGTSANPAGTNGSYVFTITLSRGMQTISTTQKTITITATPYTSVTDVQAVAAAKTVIVGGTVNVASGATQLEKTAAVQTYVNGLLTGNAAGATATVTYGSGNNYSVTISKGSVNDSTTIAMTINVGVDPNLTTVSNAKNAAEGASYSNMTQAAAIDEATITNAVKTTAETAIKDSSVTVTVTNASYTAPIAGTSANPAGTNGSYVFTITLSKGMQTISTTQKTITITATPYVAPIYDITGTVQDGNKKNVSGASVKLMLGQTQHGSKNVTTDANGKFTIAGVQNGTYNLVVEKDGIIVTTKVFVNGANCTLTDAIKMPSGKTNSVVEVKPSTPALVVGGLDSLFDSVVTANDKGFTSADKDLVETKGGSITIKLVAQSTDNTAPNANDINAAAKAKTKTIGDFMDITVLKKALDSSNNEIPAQSATLVELPALIELRIPLDSKLQGKTDYVIYRYHGSKVDEINTSPNTDPNTDGEYFTIEPDAVTLHIKKFSTYAIAYQTTTPPVTPPTGGGSGGGSGSSVASSTLTAEQSKDGTITIGTDKKTATITPNSGYVIADVMVDGKSIGATKTYTVTDRNPHKITAVFVKETALPYYIQNGGTVYIGFSTLADQCYKYIAPSGVKVEFKENPKSFVDNTIAWAKPSIDFVTARELFLGTKQDTFAPNESMTRAMFVTVIGRLYERSYGNVAGTSTFSDVDANAYYAKYVAWATDSGIIKGIGGNKFAPNEKVTREQMAVMMRNVATLLKKADVKVDSLAYPDSTTISSWAIDGAKYCQATKVITGRNGSNFAPQESATRAEVAVVMERFIHTIVK